MKKCLFFFTVAFVLILVLGQDRKITSRLNPGCKECSTEPTLIYVRADGAYDTIHQIWDFTRGAPTVGYMVASLNSSLQIFWNDRILPIEFQLSEKPKYSFAVAIDQIYAYNDTNNTGHIDTQYSQKAHSLNGAVWHRGDTVLADQEVMVRLSTQHWELGVVEIKLDLVPFKDYASQLPHLIHTANSALVEVALVNMTAPDYPAARFAIHMLLASTDVANETMNCTSKNTLDDEHTPGVFKILAIETPKAMKGDDGGYLQFRPVGYTERERDVATSTLAHVSALNRTELPRLSTIELLYRKEHPLVQDVFISLGETDDKFYKQHNYTAWSFMLGYGAPPEESFSLFVILIICIGLGVPVLLGLSGVVFVVLGRCRQRRDTRSLLINEE